MTKHETMKLIYFILFAVLLHENHGSYDERIHSSSDNIHIQYEHQLKDKSKDFSQAVDTSLFNNIRGTNCSTRGTEFCLRWGDRGQFRIRRIDEHCENYKYWTTFDKPLNVAFDVDGIHLYGADEVDNQTWPLRLTGRQNDSFVTKEFNSQSIMEPIWYTSTGYYVYVAPHVPLFVTYETKKPILRLIAKREMPYIRGTITHLDYKVCKYDNVKTAFVRAIEDTLGKPSNVPDFRMMALPIWSTWAKYKTFINHSVVLQFADDIKAHQFPNSQLEIDDAWETCYGSLTFDAKKFPNVKKLVHQLHAKGYRVTLWIHPFVNVNCAPFFEIGAKNHYFARHFNGSVIDHWWNGPAAYIDFTNPEAVDWFRMRLEKLQDETGIDSFKFDAGESTWAPKPPVFHTMADDHPETILKAYIATAAQFGTAIEVRSARQTQKHPIYVRLIDRETCWHGRLCLDTFIPEILHMNVIGYPFVLPDMVGGNGYGKDILTKELFIRWLQISVFMPVLQFSYPPWDFDAETAELSLKFVNLHHSYALKISKLMEQATKKGTMLNPPIWWIDPTDPIALTISDEFLLGDDLLVAPVLEEGATSRDIYLPKGIWRDETIKDAPLITGPKWVHNYPAGLQILPHFTKVAPTSSSAITTPSLLLIFITLLFYWWK